MSKVIIACGGTGGHLSPGIAVAEVLQERAHKCLLLISKKQVDSVLVEKYGHLNFVKTSGRAFAGGVKARVAFIFGLISGFLSSRKLIKEEAPDVVLLFGGYLSLGLGLAAKSLGVPVVLHEANCNPGRAVRLIKHIASRVYLPEGVILPGLSLEHTRYLGYPIRKEIKHFDQAYAQSRMKIDAPNKLLVVIGGSQGATALNDWVVHNFPRLAKAGITVYCVTGLGNSSEKTIHEVGSNGADFVAHFVPFSDQMADVISAADLVLSRAGAGSIAEIIRCRAPSILVPYPYAADDHQFANAITHEQHGAGLLMPQSKLSELTDTVLDLINNDSVLSTFKSNLERLDRFESSEQIALDLLKLVDSSEVLEVNKAESVI